MVEVTCDNCGKVFLRNNYRLKKNKLNFCEYDCYNKYLGVSSFGRQYRVRYENQLVDGKMLCTSCREYKDISEFNKNGMCTHRDGYSYCCKDCDRKRSIYKPINAKKNIIKSMSNPRNFINNLIGKSKKRKTSNLGNNIDIDYCMEIYNNQNGKCAISGIDMTFIRGAGVVNTNLSIDRIDSSIGYVNGNIQFVCKIVNTMKHNLSMEDLLSWCSLILKNNKNE